MYQPMNYGGYSNYAPNFGPAGRSGGFGAPMGYPSPQAAPQSAPGPIAGSAAGGFLVQPVTSREEAVAVIADPFYTGVLMPDLSHGVIYLKRFNANTGASDFGEFAFVQPKAAPEAQQEPFVPVSEFRQTIAGLREEIAALKKTGKAGKGGGEE